MHRECRNDTQPLRLAVDGVKGDERWFKNFECDKLVDTK